MNFLKSALIIVHLLLINNQCAPISDNEKIIGLQKIKYLKSDEISSWNKIIDGSTSNKDTFQTQQIGWKLPTTNNENDNTKNLKEPSFCKNSITKKLKKGYNLLSEKWHKLNLTYRFDHKNKQQFVEDNIRSILREAFNVWQKDTVLHFTEITEGTADIMISFEEPNHADVDCYAFKRRTMAHAFQPGDGLGGDIHFKKDINWDFSNSEPVDGTISFYPVALHMIGHSLGLGHSIDRNSVMYGYVFKVFTSLPASDVKGIQHIYGIPESMKNTHAQPVIDSNVLPNKCHTSYDAIAMIDDELIAFKGKYMFGPNMNVIEIRLRWIQLPVQMDHVDAVFQTSDKKVLFFINQDVYIFNSNELEKLVQLIDLGIEPSAAKVDNIFEMPNNQVIMFIGNNFYEFDVQKLMVVGSSREIVKNFTDVYDMQTAFTSNDGRTYFFKEQSFYEFDYRKMILNRMKPEISSPFFMNCVNDYEEKEDEAAINTMDAIEFEPKVETKQEVQIQEINEIKKVAPNIASSIKESLGIVICLFISLSFYNFFYFVLL